MEAGRRNQNPEWRADLPEVMLEKTGPGAKDGELRTCVDDVEAEDEAEDQ